MKAWDGVIESLAPERSTKPRVEGLTMVIDKGLGLHATEDLMATAAEVVDSLKLTFGTSAFLDSSFVKDKAKIVAGADVDIYPGGTLTEVAIAQKKIIPFLERLTELGFTAIEVSDGTLDIAPEQRSEIIQRAAEHGLKVITEVGKKDPSNLVALEEVHRLIRQDLDDGAMLVIVEARESGKGIGVFDQSGQVVASEVDAIVEGVDEPSRLMWEAPLKAQQLYLIERFGTNVSLGNIQPADILALEALRCRMRGDTLSQAFESG